MVSLDILVTPVDYGLDHPGRCFDVLRGSLRPEGPGPKGQESIAQGLAGFEWHEDKASLGDLLFYCPGGGAEEFSPGFQPWETSNKAVRPERARDGVGEMPFAPVQS